MSKLTEAQQEAVKRRGNVLVAAGAGTGKTSTLAERCLDLVVSEDCRLEEILMVTFTEAAAAEMRDRLRRLLHQRQATEPAGSPLAQRLTEEIAMLESAPISTLHGFCLELVRRNFHTLGLDPQFTVLDEQQSKPLMHAVLEELLARHHTREATDTGGESGVRVLVERYGNGGDARIRELLMTIHRYTQALAEPDRWMREQCAHFSSESPATWQQLFVQGVVEWAGPWREVLVETASQCDNVRQCLAALESLPSSGATMEQVTGALRQIQVAADPANWKHGTIGKFKNPLRAFFTAAEQLASFGEGDALVEDWQWTRLHMLTLLRLAEEFSRDFAQAKREQGGIDFADQEQFALRLLYGEDGALSPVAQECRKRFKYVFVDECQDINAAQDAILRAVSGEGGEANRFLVGDVKQSIYRFRLADPRIFQGCADRWKTSMFPGAAPSAPDTVPVCANRTESKAQDGGHPDPYPAAGNQPILGRVSPAHRPDSEGSLVSLVENFRSQEGLLRFINPLFATLMRRVIGGVTYDTDAELKFGDPVGRAALSCQALAERVNNSETCVELHVLLKPQGGFESGDETASPSARSQVIAELQSAEREARLIARRLRKLRESGHKVWDRERREFVPVDYRDMVVLMRGVAGRAEIIAKAFHHEGVPLNAERGGFLDAIEVTDLLNLLRLLDNPLQDLPLLAVLRSPLVGMSAEELVEVRLSRARASLWSALQELSKSGTPGSEKAKAFLGQFRRWREVLRHAPLTHCLEAALAETHYAELLLAEERGPARVANVKRFVDLARRFDPLQREGLFRFLQFIAEQEEAEVRQEPAPLSSENAVRLQTIHASKGLEFPVVALAGLGNRFNLQDLRHDILLNEELGLCPKVVAPKSRQRYAGIAHWVANQRERRALLGEEMRLLYVALTRARDLLILVGTATMKDELDRWKQTQPATDLALTMAGHYLDWLRLWFGQVVRETEWTNDHTGVSNLLRWQFHEPDDAEMNLSELRQSGVEGALIASPTAAEFASIQECLEWDYRHATATQEPAKSSVSILRRRAVERDEEAVTLFRPASTSRRTAPARRKDGKLSGAEIGSAHHAFMQLVSLEHAGSVAELQEEARILEQAGALAAEELEVLNFKALAAFWQSDLGRRLRSQPAANVHREMPFTARVSAADLWSLGLSPNRGELSEDEFVVVQGAVDLAVILEKEIWLLDLKTDAIERDGLKEKVRQYEPQLHLYAFALSRIHSRPVTNAWLHFLSTGETVRITPLA